jgi:Fur family zinc uptake transcriptional regulator
MTRDSNQHCLDNAERLCAHQGNRLTSKRRRILALLLDADRPLSAYQVSDLYKHAHQQQLSIMSVYRMLNFLISQHLVHRLETTNQYLACAHINTSDACGDAHGASQFLICDKCKQVDETGMHAGILKQLNLEVEKNGFTMQQQQLEIHGTCRRCAEASPGDPSE